MSDEAFEIASKADRVRAAAPDVSAWVSANAGSGKTHLLVARVLRLLLSGTLPSRILCLTYTKAAAAEMAERIFRQLGEWVMLDDEALGRALHKLTDAEQPHHVLQRARSLFAVLTDAPEGLRIQTIHSFCQSLLKRFPLEAGIAPHFTVIDERTTQELLHEAGMRLFAQSLRSGDAALRAAVEELAARMNEGSFHELLQEIAGNRRRLHALRDGLGFEAAHRLLCRRLDVREEDDDALFARCFQYRDEESAGLRGCLQALLASVRPKDKATARMLESWLGMPDKRRECVRDYVDHYHTKAGSPCAPKTLFTKDALSDAQKAILLAEQERACAFRRAECARLSARLTGHLLTLSHALLAEYEALKNMRAVADYDDLITAVTQLLSQNSIAPWVMYKLDGGIDHVLIDEAQDTSREQWLIARALTEEFFAGRGASEKTRTLFAVGDLKQSIYRFQGASPELFHAMRQEYGALANDAALAWADVALPESFRSTQAVLDAVDKVFAQAEADVSVGDTREPIHHVLTRKGQAGRVEVWPLIKAQKDADAQWQMPRQRVQREKPVQKLAALTAHTIAGWLESGEMLESRARPIEPGDIMVLVRRRAGFAQALMRELRMRGVPVAGADRLVLTQSLAVQDLLALAHFLLLPEDDLVLAALLKCPLFDIDEELLFTLSHARGKATLWQRLGELSGQHPAFAKAHELLTVWLEMADFAPPFEFFSTVLEAQGGRARFRARMGDATQDVLDEFLAQALAYEQAHVPSLQGFAHWMARGKVEIKRDMEQGRREVRIMTVHAAKGLQAPIVILPDTAGGPAAKFTSRLLWDEEGEHNLLVWCAGAGEAPALVEEIKEQRRQRDMAEYRRLLYVAMTRAEERLYICGAETRQGAAKGCWHELVWNGLKETGQRVETPAGEGLLLQTPQVAAPKPDKAIVAAPPAINSMPVEWLLPVPAEPATTRPLSPSHLWEETPGAPATSPAGQTQAFERGMLIHRLLQYLPDVAAAERPAAALRLLARHRLKAQEAEALAQEVTALIDRPEFAGFFGPNALAEAPIAGMVCMNGMEYPIAGQIDRLLVAEREIWLLDYKTNAQAPKSPQAVPLRYIRQMAAYRALLLGIYPGRRVRSALLWTSVPLLMELPDEALAPLCQPLTKAQALPTFSMKAS